MVDSHANIVSPGTVGDDFEGYTINHRSAENICICWYISSHSGSDRKKYDMWRKQNIWFLLKKKGFWITLTTLRMFYFR